MSRGIDAAFDLDNDIDAQWFAWGVVDGFGLTIRTPPERDGAEPDSALLLRTRSYQAGLTAGATLRAVAKVDHAQALVRIGEVERELEAQRNLLAAIRRALEVTS